MTVDDLTQFERRYHLAHRFPDFDARQGNLSRRIAEGFIAECQPMPDCQWVSSDIRIDQTYESHALPSAPSHLSIIVMLEGEAELTRGHHRCRLGPGQSALLGYDRRRSLSARHVAQPRVRAINVTLTAQALSPAGRFGSLARFIVDGDDCRRLSLTEGLLRSLDEWMRLPGDDAGAALMTEGLALQILGQAISHIAPGGETPAMAVRDPEACGKTPASLTPRDHRLLARVRDHLERHPGSRHSLDALAELACMSTSSLRHKYQCRYGHSVFDHLRAFRLQLARRLLQEGMSIQEVTHRVGYRHPTNFATAFRHFHGLTPRQVN